jgi:hypothetical protein
MKRWSFIIGIILLFIELIAFCYGAQPKIVCLLALLAIICILK